MDWILTHTGRRFFPLAPRVEDIDPRDFAHALSLLCRFNGHCRVFYSVAEHSVRVSRALSPDLALWGLLHDAGEAYLADVPRPLKRNLVGYREAEERVLRAVATRFGLPWPLPAEVAAADDRLLATEARDLMAPMPPGAPPFAEPFPDTIVPWSPGDAERKFLDIYQRLRVTK